MPPSSGGSRTVKYIPIYFRFRQIVCGRGFIAYVGFLGRATCTRESDAIWMGGVNPGALADAGETLETAYVNFRHTLVSAFFAFAETAVDFQEFREDAQSFFEATDDVSVNEWKVVREAIRAGARLDEDSAGLQRETGDPDPNFTVVELQPDKALPEMNYFEPHQPAWLAA